MSLTLLLLVAGFALVTWFRYRRSVRVPCATVREGDEVLLHGAPDHIPLGERRLLAAEATVTHVSPPRRMLTRVLGTTSITELYDVGFEG
jgi:hypothetical protein